MAHTLKSFTLLLALCMGGTAYAQTLPAVIDHSPEITHKAQHERTVFYKVVNGKQVACGLVAEFRSGAWHAYVVGEPPAYGPHFETRDEAVKWITPLCPVAGKPGHE